MAPFWGEVVKSALTSEGILGLFKAGWTTIKGAREEGGRWECCWCLVSRLAMLAGGGGVQ